MKSQVEHAYNKAKECLRQCYSELGIYAGKMHFDDYWARDGFFASLGATAIGDYKISKKELLLFLSKQKEDGQLPLRIGSKLMIAKLFRIGASREDKTKSVRYTIDRAYPNGMSKIPVDQNSLFLVATEYYIRKSRDRKFAKENYEKIKNIIDWNFKQDSDSDLLIEEGYYSNWLDGIKKSGKAIYTESCHYYACKSFAQIAKGLRKWKDYKKYSHFAEEIKQRINSLMWNGSYYTDWISSDGRRHEYFSTDGNILAIVFGIADNEKAGSIIGKLSELGLENGVPYRTNYPKYKWYEIDPLLLYIAGIPDYHNGMSWLWIGCAGILAKAIAGKKKNAVFLAEKVSEIIMKYGGTYEVYEKKSESPVRRIFYRSEFPFAWAAGMFLYALKESGIKKS
jgi:glycogen debranching enzyme